MKNILPLTLDHQNDVLRSFYSKDGADASFPIASIEDLIIDLGYDPRIDRQRHANAMFSENGLIKTMQVCYERYDEYDDCGSVYVVIIEEADAYHMGRVLYSYDSFAKKH